MYLDDAAADYEMLSRLDDPARNPSNRRPLTDSQLSELPTHTYRPSKGASSHAQQETSSSPHGPLPTNASSSKQGTLPPSMNAAWNRVVLPFLALCDCFDFAWTLFNMLHAIARRNLVHCQSV